MSESEVKEGQTGAVQAEAPVMPSVEDLAKQLEAIKAAQSGSDRAYQEAARKAKELAEENEKLKKEKMSEKEKAEYELAKRAAEIEAKEREVKDATLRLSKMRLLGEKSIPLDLGNIIDGGNEEEYAKNLETLNKHVERLVNERVNATLGNVKAPVAGAEKNEDPMPSDWRELERKYQGR